MLQFDEYKVKLNNIKPALDELAQALSQAMNDLAQAPEAAGR